MLNDIVAHDISQAISVPDSTTQNRLLSPRTGITGRLRAPPTGRARPISEQAFQEQACIRRNTLLREQRTYPLLDLSKRRRPQRKRLLNRRDPRPRHSNHGCPWIQTSPNKATVMLGASMRLSAIAYIPPCQAAPFFYRENVACTRQRPGLAMPRPDRRRWATPSRHGDQYSHRGAPRHSTRRAWIRPKT